MCGRFTLRTPAPVVAELFHLPEVPELEPRYNIAPTQPAAAVRHSTENAGREFAFFRWGLIPFWADDPSIGNRMINARAETVAEKPAYRHAFRKRRCLILADGFYEWKKIDGRKQPYYIRREDDEPFAFAGLWERWDKQGVEIESCTIVVTEANDRLRPIHHRMPAILAPDEYDLWLDPDVGDAQRLTPLLQPRATDGLVVHPVRTVVNSPATDDPTCIEPAE